VTVRVLDATCGGRSIWIDKDHADAVYADLRIRDEGFCGHGGRTYSIQPDVQCDYRDLPFTADSFDAAVIDPPHATRGDGMEQLKGVVTKKYGALEAETWHDDLRRAFAELWRVVRTAGTVVLKFNDVGVDFEDVISLAPEEPLVGTTTKKNNTETRWFLFGVTDTDAD